MRKQDSINCNRNFPSTQWSLIVRTQSSDPNESLQAKEELLRTYLPVLRAYLVIRERVTHAQASDFVQEFALKKLIAADILHRASPSKGKLRNFLLVCLKNLIRDHYRSRKNRELPGDQEVLESALPSQEEFDLFDGIWARNAFIKSLQRMKEECESQGNLVRWQVFCHRVIVPLASTSPPPTYAALVEKTGLENAKAVQNSLVNGKRMFKKCLEETMLDYLGDEALVEYEINDLCDILSNTKSLKGDSALQCLLPDSVFEPPVADAFTNDSGLFESVVRDCNSDKILWSDNDLTTIWRQTMNSRWSDIAGDQASTVSDPVLQDLIHDDSPDIETLNRVRRGSRTLYRETGIPVYFALYGSTIASALVSAGTEITSLNKSDLQRTFKTIAMNKWLDETTLQLLNNAAVVLSR